MIIAHQRRYSGTVLPIVNDLITVDCDSGEIVCVYPGPTSGVHYDPSIACLSYSTEDNYGGECMIQFKSIRDSGNTCTKNIDRDQETDNVYVDISVNHRVD